MSTLFMGARGGPFADRPTGLLNRPSILVRKTERMSLSVLCSLHARRFQGVECEVTERTVVLRGAVTSYYEKQLAQELVRTHRIGLAIINCIEVLRGTE